MLQALEDKTLKTIFRTNRACYLGAEPIVDPVKWAKLVGCQMVTVRDYVKWVDGEGKEFARYIEEYEVPEYFACLRGKPGPGKIVYDTKVIKRWRPEE